MRPLALLVLTLALALAGCADPMGAPSTPDGDADAGGDGPSSSSTPPAGSAAGPASSSPASSSPATSTGASGSSGSAAACEGGDGDAFLASSHGAGALPDAMRPRLVEIAREGVIRVLWGHTEPGSGVIREEEGAMDGLSLDEAKAMLARRNFTYEDLDLVIERGDRATLPAAAYADFCRRVVDTLPKLQDEYPHAAGCADYMPKVTWDVSTTAGARTIVVSDCAAEGSPGLAEFRVLQRDHDRLVGPG